MSWNLHRRPCRLLAAATLLVAAAAAPAGFGARADLAGAAAAGVFLTFSVNVQDFAYPEQSPQTVGRVIDLHEQYGLPVDIALSDTMLEIHRSDHPAPMDRLATSP